VVDPDLELSEVEQGEGGSFVVLALKAFLPSVIFLFSYQTRGGGGEIPGAPIAPPKRHTTEINIENNY